MKRYFAIGDIHGCFVELQKLIETIAGYYDLKDSENILVFLGDYIDRGDSSSRVLSTLIEIKYKLPQSVFLMGNHEYFYLKGEPLDSNDLPTNLDPNYLEFLKKLKLFYETTEILFIHAGPFDSHGDLDSQSPEDFLFNYSPPVGGWKGKIIVRGHSVVKEVSVNGRVLSVDTGCTYGQKLSCVVLFENGQIEKIISVNRRTK